MERQLIHYLPYTVRGFKEYQGITAGEQPEFELVWNWVAEVLNNQFIVTAEKIGLSRWEQILQITPKATDTFNLRRLRILAALWKRVPYTFPWFQEWVNMICGPDGHTETVEDYTLHIVMDANVLSDVTEKHWIILSQLPGVVPENLLVELMRIWQSTGIVCVGGFTWFKQTMEIWPEVVSDLGMTGKNNLKSIASLKSKMEVYPDDVHTLAQMVHADNTGLIPAKNTLEIYSESTGGNLSWKMI